MRLEQLRYFVMVAKLGSIHKAAETLYVSQPNISRAINSLEKKLEHRYYFVITKEQNLPKQEKVCSFMHKQSLDIWKP